MSNTRPSVHVLAKGANEADAKRNLEKAAVFLLQMRDKVPRAWGNRDVPPGALHAKRIQVGIGIPLSADDDPPANRLFLDIRADKHHFFNPQEEQGIPTPKRAACFALTPDGEKWASDHLADYNRGFKSWLMDWGDGDEQGA
jgi:hypothetical protein